MTYFRRNTSSPRRSTFSSVSSSGSKTDPAVTTAICRGWDIDVLIEICQFLQGIVRQGFHQKFLNRVGDSSV